MWAKPPAAPVIHCGERLSLADGESQSTVHLFQRLTWGHTTFQPTAPRQVVAISLTINPLYNTVVLESIDVFGEPVSAELYARFPPTTSRRWRRRIGLGCRKTIALSGEQPVRS